MPYVFVKHSGLGSAIDDTWIIEIIDETKTWDEIKKIIKNTAKQYVDVSEILWKCIIKIIHTNGEKYILNDKYAEVYKLFNTNDNNLNIKIEVIWEYVKSAQLTQSIGM